MSEITVGFFEQKVATEKLRPGIGAKKFDKLKGCLLLREGMARSLGTLRPIFLKHIDFDDEESYACKRFCHLTKEGIEDLIFENKCDIVAVDSDAGGEDVPVHDKRI